MKTIIIGGVAAGAGAAARLRRLDEKAEIILLEKGDFISYANCGLPYHLGGVIPERDNLLVMPPEKFAAWFNITVRTRHEALRIDRAKKIVTVGTEHGEYEETYDKLLLATGAVPAGPAFPEGEHPRITHLWTLGDMDRAVDRLKRNARKVLVIGAGFIGLEVAENLRERGLEVAVVQRGNHVLPTVDPEMAGLLHTELARLGIVVHFGCTVKDYEESGDAVTAVLDNGERLTADFVIVSTGVVPASRLAQEAGLACGPRGHITVNELMQTSDPDIYAAGDVVEIADPVFGGRTAIPLAGPANKQGRIAADNLAGGHSVYRGSLGTSVVKVGALTAAAVGLTETRLKAQNRPFRKLYLHPSSSASYYPGAARISLKLLFGDDGAIYGAQIVGAKGMDKRIDAIAQAMRSGLKAPELGELELAYAPPYSSAKDPVNFAGFVAGNLLSGLSDAVYPDAIPADATVLDVREEEEHELGAIPGAINIPLGRLRERLSELDRGRLIVTCCQVGLRGYLAERILKQNGFRAANLSGGWLTWKMFHPAPVPAVAMPASAPAAVSGAARKTVAAAQDEPETLDLRTLPCPGPVIKLKEVLKEAAPGTTYRILAAAGFENDLVRWCGANGCTLRDLRHDDGALKVTLVKGEKAAVPAAPCGAPEHSVAIVLFSNDLDKALAALILANGLAASGAKVGIFFTFWGLSVLRRKPERPVKKNLISGLFGRMLPAGAEKLALSKMHMLGIGTAMMKKVMRKQRVLTLPELIRSARAAGVRFIACDMAMGVMGITREELIEVDEVAGVAAFAELAKNSNNTLFI